jgi:predicted ATPase
MKITALTIPEAENNFGLKEINMKRIDKIVLLAGKNGAGKTRLLKSVEKKFMSSRDKYRRILAIKNGLEKKINNPDYAAQEESVKNAILNFHKETGIIIENYVENGRIAHLVPKDNNLKLTHNYSREEIKRNAKGAESIGAQELSKFTIPYIEKILEQKYNASIPETKTTEENRIIATNRYNHLITMIKVFIDLQIERDIDGDVLFNGGRSEINLFSEGQKILLQFCVMIHAQRQNYEDLIVFLDEPENHLHPSGLIEIIEIMSKAIPNGQIWIATHSIPLLAHFDPKYLWFVDDGGVEYGGRKPENVLSSLLGNDQEKEKLQQFLNLPAIFAMNRYAAECLIPPQVVLTDSSDSQTNQIRERITMLLENLGSDENLNLLDYGAGKGRLLSNINDASPELVDRINYYAFDSDDKNKEVCNNVIFDVYGHDQKRYYNKISNIIDDGKKATFHVVILCNVLHEIESGKWQGLFSPRGEISSLLRDDGFLLLVEDQQIPVGEKAYNNGFIVLDTGAIRDLFKIKENEDELIVDSIRDGRLKAHLIPKTCLTKITEGSIKEALITHLVASKENIELLRSEEGNFKNGIQHGFWVQQYTNTHLELDLINKK